MKHSNTQKRNTRSTTARHLGQIPQKDFFAEMETRRQQLIKYPTVFKYLQSGRRGSQIAAGQKESRWSNSIMTLSLLNSNLAVTVSEKIIK